MKIAVLPAVVALLALGSPTVAQGNATPAQPAPAIPLGAQVNIAVGEFTCKAAKCFSGLGGGISDALTTALLETGKFSVFERENLGTLNEEAFASGGADFQGADLVVFGSITAFEPEVQGGGISLFGIGLSQKESLIVVDLRIVDVKSRRTIAGTRVEGKSTAQGVSVRIFGDFGGSSSGSVEKAVAAMLEQAVTLMLRRIPASYYKLP